MPKRSRPKATEAESVKKAKRQGDKITDVGAEIDRRIKMLDKLPDDPALEVARMLAEMMDTAPPGSHVPELMAKLTLDMEQDLRKEEEKNCEEERRKVANEHEKETSLLRLQLGVTEMKMAELRRDHVEALEIIEKGKTSLIDAHRCIEQLQARNQSLTMAAAPKSWRECSICLMDFTLHPERQPRVIGCGHTLCQQCVDRCKSSEFVLKCPIDRNYTFRSISSLPINYHILSNL